MSVREFINLHRWLAASVAGVLVIIMVALFLRSRLSAPATEVPGAAGLTHYTTDDGATWFTDRADRVPPFKKDGKDAVRAYVYRDVSGKQFVSHVERYTAEAQRALAALASLPPEQRAMEDPSSLAGGLDGIEVKRPGETTWVRASTPRGQSIMQPRSPGGKSDGLEYVPPR